LSPIIKNDGISSTEEFMDEVGANYSANVAGLFAMMEQHSQLGRQSFNSKQCHCVDQNEKIYEYIKGGLRLFWFEDEGRVVVCTHGIIKKSQKTPKQDKNRAKQVKRQYMESKAAGQLDIIEEE